MSKIQRYDGAFEEDVDKVANGKFVLYAQYLADIAAVREECARLADVLWARDEAHNIAAAIRAGGKEKTNG